MVVLADTNNRNHICEAVFYNNAEPKKVIYEANVSDLNGYTDITSVNLRWYGNIYNMTRSSGSGSNAIEGV